MAQGKSNSDELNHNHDHDNDHDHDRRHRHRHRHHRHHHHHHNHHHHHHHRESKNNIDPWLHFQIAMNADGTLDRYNQIPLIPATGDEENVKSLPLPAVLSKDIVLDTEKKTWLRIYRPSNLTPGATARLPIVFSFHAGGFIIFKVDTCFVHERMAKFAAAIPAVMVSVEFRYAPENRLPAHYEDAVDAIKWVKDQALKQEAGDPWLRDYGDFSRCYLYGKCSGGNIALNAAIRAADLNLEPISIVGLILNQPLFGGNKRTKSEIKHAEDPILPLPCTDLLWELALPIGADRDHRYSNPSKDPDTMEKMNRVGRILVVGFGGDPIMDRQEEFVRILTLQGIPVEARFDMVGFHSVDSVDPQRADAITSIIREFMAV